MAVQVNLEIADGNGGRAVPVCAPDDGIKVRQQFKPVERLGQIAVCAGTKGGNLVIGCGIAGNDENRHRNVVLADQARQSGAVTVRKVDVEKHGIDVIVLEFRQRGFDVVCCRLKMACFFQCHAQNVGYNWIVFYN